MQPWPPDSTNRSRPGQAGSAGLWRRCRVHITWAIGEAPSGSPGWPDFACSTASSESVRTVFTHSRSVSSNGGCTRAPRTGLAVAVRRYHRLRRRPGWPSGQPGRWGRFRPDGRDGDGPARRCRPGRHQDPDGDRRRAASGARAVAPPHPQGRRPAGRGRRDRGGAHEALAAAAAEPAQLDGIGIGSPGTSDDAAGTVTQARNVTADWTGSFALAAAVGKPLGGPAVRLGNDVKVGTIAEAQLGAGRGHRSLLGVFWGTGVGSGIILRRAAHGRAAAPPARSATWW